MCTAYPLGRKHIRPSPKDTGLDLMVSTERCSVASDKSKKPPKNSATSYSPTDYTAVPSAMEGLTSGFGMGPGVPPPPKSLSSSEASFQSTLKARIAYIESTLTITKEVKKSSTD